MKPRKSTLPLMGGLVAATATPLEDIAAPVADLDSTFNALSHEPQV